MGSCAASGDETLQVAGKPINLKPAAPMGPKYAWFRHSWGNLPARPTSDLRQESSLKKTPKQLQGPFLLIGRVTAGSER